MITLPVQLPLPMYNGSRPSEHELKGDDRPYRSQVQGCYGERQDMEAELAALLDATVIHRHVIFQDLIGERQLLLCWAHLAQWSDLDLELLNSIFWGDFSLDLVTDEVLDENLHSNTARLEE